MKNLFSMLLLLYSLSNFAQPAVFQEGAYKKLILDDEVKIVSNGRYCAMYNTISNLVIPYSDGYISMEPFDPFDSYFKCKKAEHLGFHIFDWNGDEFFKNECDWIHEITSLRDNENDQFEWRYHINGSPYDGLYNKDMEPIIGFNRCYDRITIPSHINDFIEVHVDKYAGLCKWNGEEIISPYRGYTLCYFDYKDNVIQISKDDKHGLCDKNGYEIIPPIYPNIICVSPVDNILNTVDEYGTRRYFDVAVDQNGRVYKKQRIDAVALFNGIAQSFNQPIQAINTNARRRYMLQGGYYLSDNSRFRFNFNTARTNIYNNIRNRYNSALSLAEVQKMGQNFWQNYEEQSMVTMREAFKKENGREPTEEEEKQLRAMVQDAIARGIAQYNMNNSSLSSSYSSSSSTSSASSNQSSSDREPLTYLEEIDCTFCAGSGDCKWCKDGWVIDVGKNHECPNCYAPLKGKCHQCQGTGKRKRIAHNH